MKPYRSPQKLPPQIAEHRRKQSRARSAVMELRFQGRLTQAGLLCFCQLGNKVWDTSCKETSGLYVGATLYKARFRHLETAK